jgi:hypothetical protein
MVLIIWNQTSPNLENTKKNRFSNAWWLTFSISATINFAVPGFYFPQLTVKLL